MRFLILALAALLLWPLEGLANPPSPAPRVGDTFEVKLERTTEGSSGSSFTRNTLIERVAAVREDGLELEFALPENSGRQWQFPVRVFRTHQGTLRLLNEDELGRRLDAWLAAARLSRAACGRWVFTWTAYKIECDLQSAMRIAGQFDLRSRGFTDGALYQEEGTLEPAPLRRTVGPSDSAVFSVRLSVDPEAVRRGFAERDVALGQITGEAVTLEDAMRAHAQDRVSGTVSITFEMDLAGDISRRTTTSVLETVAADGSLDTDTTTEVLTRQRLASR